MDTLFDQFLIFLNKGAQSEVGLKSFNVFMAGRAAAAWRIANEEWNFQAQLSTHA